MAEKERTEDEKTELEEAFKQQQSEMQERVPSMTKCRRPVYCFRYFVLFSLFGSIWTKHLDTDCFRYFASFY